MIYEQIEAATSELLTPDCLQDIAVQAAMHEACQRLELASSPITRKVAIRAVQSALDNQVSELVASGLPYNQACNVLYGQSDHDEQVDVADIF